MSLIKNIVMLVGLVIVAVYGLKLYHQANNDNVVDHDRVKAMCDNAVNKAQVIKDALIQKVETARMEANRTADKNAPSRKTGPAGTTGQALDVKTADPVDQVTVNSQITDSVIINEEPAAISAKAGPVDLEDRQITAEVLDEIAPPAEVELPPSRPITPEEVKTITRIYQEASEALR